jgi:hypothetical protein
MFDPFALTTPQKYYPPHFTARIPAQHGLFTVEPDPISEPVVPDGIKILVPSAVKVQLRNRLSLLGFHDESMFPDLDGTCAHLSWRLRTNQGSWPTGRQPGFGQ